ncbi:MAG: hypothetical protein PHU04_05585 [Candidatus Peribacteraceae bacterium]|nr:hypothetical protein [Candidatus Peribacteraceae bacterium]
MMLDMLKIISIFFTVIVVGVIVVIGVPALYDLLKVSFLDYIAPPSPVLNVLKVRKLDFSKEYEGGGFFFHTVDGKGRIIHLSPDFNTELALKNLTTGFFDIPDDCNECSLFMFHLKNTNKKKLGSPLGN